MKLTFDSESFKFYNRCGQGLQENGLNSIGMIVSLTEDVQRSVECRGVGVVKAQLVDLNRGVHVIQFLGYYPHSCPHLLLSSKYLYTDIEYKG